MVSADIQHHVYLLSSLPEKDCAVRFYRRRGSRPDTDPGRHYRQKCRAAPSPRASLSQTAKPLRASVRSSWLSSPSHHCRVIFAVLVRRRLQSVCFHPTTAAVAGHWGPRIRHCLRWDVRDDLSEAVMPRRQRVSGISSHAQSCSYDGTTDSTGLAV